MISVEQDETAVSLPYAVIYKAITKAELSVRMQRDFLTRQFDSEIEAMKQRARRKKYIEKNFFIWRIGHFLNGDRAMLIRKIKLTAAEILAAENQALISCVDMSALTANMDIAHKLKTTISMNMNRKSLTLPAQYLQFVMTFNPEAFEAEQGDASLKEKTDKENQQQETAESPADKQE